MKTFLFNIYKIINKTYLLRITKYYYFYFYNIVFNKVTISQNKNYKTIPIIIISFNQLLYLKKIISYLKENDYLNLVIIDNNSSYEPLLNYFDEIKDTVTIYRLSENLGHMVFWKKKEIFEKYNKGYYIVTDADIVPNKSCPDDFVLKFKKILDRTPKLSKVGFSLKIDDIPDTNPNKKKVLDWEGRFWTQKTKRGDFFASIDTTFALYPPKNVWFYRKHFYHAIRTNIPYTAIHGGWYFDINNLSKEQQYYLNSANSSASWNMDNSGNLTNDVCY